ncbi:MAG: hypothetical protein WC679_12750 [Bacteroidales bacterium]|jgi:hypothetical protein
MAAKIDQKIVGYTVKKTSEKVELNLEKMSELIERPDILIGKTYKIKTPNTEHSLYVTINDIILNLGSEFEERRPYEIFFQSKDTAHVQWTAALTRVMSGVLRKGGDITFLVDELKNVYDPKAGYMAKGGKFIPSLIADIGYVIEKHLVDLGIIVKEIDKNMEEFIEKKKVEFKGKEGQLCTKCNSKSLFLMDGCMTCTTCGDSKCN